MELLVLSANFLPLGIPICMFFKTFVFLFNEVTPVLPIRQFDLIKLWMEPDSNSQPLKVNIYHNVIEALTITS